MKRILLLCLLLCLLGASSAMASSKCTYLDTETGEIVESSELDFSYTLLEDGTARLDHLYTKPTGSLLQLPSTIDGKTVTAVHGNSLLNELSPNIKEVMFPATLAEIYNAPETGMQSVLIFGPYVKQVSFTGEHPDFTVSEDGLLYQGNRLVGCLDAGRRSTAEIAPGTTAADLQVFAYCTKLETITIPASLTELNTFTRAVYDTQWRPDHLKEYIVDPENPAFSAHEGLLYAGDTLLSCPPATPNTVIHVKPGTTTISSYAFYDCDTFSELILSDSVQHIGKYAVYSCGALTTVTLSESLNQLDEGAFSYCWRLRDLVLPSGNQTYRLEDGLLIDPARGTLLLGLDVQKATHVQVPQEIRRIGKRAFCCHASLETVELPDTLEAIGEEAFSFTYLKSVVMPDSLTTLENGAFYCCERLTSAAFPDNTALKAIPESLFSDCKKLQTVTFPALCGITALEDYAFFNCTSLRSITLPDGISSFGLAAFDSCSALTDISFPAQLKEIGFMCFYNCISLKELDLPEGLTTIDGSAFSGCTVLRHVRIPSTISEVSLYDFSDSQVTLFIPAGTKLSGTVYSFKGTVVVHDGSVAAKYCQNHDIPHMTLTDWAFSDPLFAATCTDPQVQALLDSGGSVCFTFAQTMQVTITDAAGQRQQQEYSYRIHENRLYLGENWLEFTAGTDGSVLLTTPAWTMLLLRNPG